MKTSLLNKLGMLALTGLSVASVGTTASSLSGCSDEARPKLRVGMLHWAAYAPINVAATKGFWSKRGIDVEVTNRTSNQELNEDLKNGRIDVALDMMGSWVGIHLGGTPLKIIGATDWSYGGDVLIVNKTLDTTKIKGQEVAVYLNQPSVLFFLGKYLETLPTPLKLGDVKVVELETKKIADAFIAGTYNITINYDPEASRQVSDGAPGKIEQNSGSVGFRGVIPEGFVGRADIMQTVGKDTLKKFVAGWQEAVSWAYSDADNQKLNLANKAEFYDIMRKQTFAGDRPDTDPFTEKELDSFIAGVKVHSANTQLCVNEKARGMKLKDSNIGNEQPLRDYLTELKDFLNGSSILTSAPTNLQAFENEQNGIFDNTAVVEALKELGATCSK